MKLIGLSGPAGAGKDTIADYLVETYGFTKFSFSDALYEEVAKAFGINKSVLYHRETKETPLICLKADRCEDPVFQQLMLEQFYDYDPRTPADNLFTECSPRQVLQWWGTEYRRKQDPDYWLKKAAQFVEAYLALAAEDPAKPRSGLVNCSVRFPNERAFVESRSGEVWHVTRPNWDANVQDSTKVHVAEQGLTAEPQDKIVHNNGTVEQLRTSSSLLLAAQPGALIYAGGQSIPDYVTCTACGHVHHTVTRTQAQQEVTEFNAWYDKQTEEVKHRFNGLAALLDYEGCNKCKGKEFRVSKDGDAPDGCAIPPVIYEPTS